MRNLEIESTYIIKTKTGIEQVAMVFAGSTWVILNETYLKQKQGRPAKRFARSKLLLRKLNGTKLFQSFHYNDDTFCEPF